MKIDPGATPILASQRMSSAAQRVAGASPAMSDFRSGAAASEATGLKPVDFTSMTRQGLFDWMNTQIKSGEMSLDDSSGFLGMTLKMPVGGTAASLDSQEKVDFMQLARDGIAWAKQHNEASQAQMLQTAMGIMQQRQGDPIGIDIQA